MNMRMKNLVVPVALGAALLAGVAGASAWDIKDVLGGVGNIGDTVGNLVEGVFTKSDLTVADIAGEYVTDGSAVSFKSDNLLKKAGGVAAAAAIETKINPYYEQLGLNDAEMTINTDGTFTLKAKRLTLGGTMESNGDGTFEVVFKAFGKVSLGSMTAFVQKSGNHVDIMFDATKLKTLVSAIAKITGIQMAKTAASVLDSYDGLCLGFGMDRKSDGKTPSTGGAKEAVGSILDVLKGGK